MYDNVFIGENAHNQPKRILILGESHYEESGKIDGGTASVVKYLAINGNDNKTQFYKNIMRTFGYEISKESRNEFWNKGRKIFRLPDGTMANYEDAIKWLLTEDKKEEE